MDVPVPVQQQVIVEVTKAAKQTRVTNRTIERRRRPFSKCRRFGDFGGRGAIGSDGRDSRQNFANVVKQGADNGFGVGAGAPGARGGLEGVLVHIHTLRRARREKVSRGDGRGLGLADGRTVPISPSSPFITSTRRRTFRTMCPSALYLSKACSGGMPLSGPIAVPLSVPRSVGKSPTRVQLLGSFPGSEAAQGAGSAGLAGGGAG